MLSHSRAPGGGCRPPDAAEAEANCATPSAGPVLVHEDEEEFHTPLGSSLTGLDQERLLDHDGQFPLLDLDEIEEFSSMMLSPCDGMGDEVLSPTRCQDSPPPARFDSVAAAPSCPVVSMNGLRSSPPAGLATPRSESPASDFSPRQFQSARPHKGTAMAFSDGDDACRADSMPVKYSPLAHLRPHSQFVETHEVVTGEDEDGNKTINQYAVLRTLGKGQFGKVKLVVHNDSGKLFAIKIMKRSLLHALSGQLDTVKHEIAIMKKLNHENVVRLFEVIDDVTSQKLYIIMQYVEKGPVATITHHGTTSCGPMPLDRVRSYVRDMLAGVQYLHRQCIIHRDLKPENMLVNRDDRLLIADFGVSVITETADRLVSRAGTPAFLAPEALRDNSACGKMIDIWALGVTIYCLLFGRLPFYCESSIQLEEAVIHQPVQYDAATPSDALHFLQRVLVKAPAERASLEDLGRHAFVTAGAALPCVRPDASPAIQTDETEVAHAILQGSNIRLADKLAMLVKIKSRMTGAVRRARQSRLASVPSAAPPVVAASPKRSQPPAPAKPPE